MCGALPRATAGMQPPGRVVRRTWVHEPFPLEQRIMRPSVKWIDVIAYKYLLVQMRKIVDDLMAFCLIFRGIGK